MGLTVLTVEVANPASPDQREPVEFLVDSGAVYSFVPSEILHRLGIVPHSRQRFRIADGSTIERDRGDAVFFYAGQRGAAPVIFAEPGDATLLGAVSLESLGFVLDAVRRDLLPLPMVIAGSIKNQPRRPSYTPAPTLHRPDITPVAWQHKTVASAQRFYRTQPSGAPRPPRLP
jgi:predicted aspartyl protease